MSSLHEKSFNHEYNFGFHEIRCTNINKVIVVHKYDESNECSITILEPVTVHKALSHLQVTFEFSWLSYTPALLVISDG